MTRPPRTQIAPYGLTHSIVEILRLAAFCLARLMPHYQAELKVDRTRSLSHTSLHRLARCLTNAASSTWPWGWRLPLKNRKSLCGAASLVRL